MNQKKRNEVISDKIKFFTEQMTTGPDAEERCQQYLKETPDVFIERYASLYRQMKRITGQLDEMRDKLHDYIDNDAELYWLWRRKIEESDE